MKFPFNEKWNIDHSSDKGLALLATRNITFRDKKLAKLAPKNIRIYDEVDNVNFETPVSFNISDSTGNIDDIFTNDNKPFSVNLDTPITFTESGAANAPSGSFDSSGCKFAGKWVLSEANDIHTYDGSTWVDVTVTLTSGYRHPLCVFRNRNNLAVGNGNQVKQYNTSFTETVNLSLPEDIEVTGLAYNRNLLAVVGASSSGEGHLFIWDGATSQANFGYPLNSARGIFVVAYKDTFVVLTGEGEGLYWTGSGLERLFAFPAYFKSYQFGEVRSSNRTVAHDTSVQVIKQRIYMNVQLVNESRNEEPNRYEPLQPSGVWVFDPEVGLYHENSHTGAKIIEKSATQANVNTSTDVITVSATVPDTGTPVIKANSNVAIGGIKQKVLYYTIKVSSTTFKLAATYEDAIAGTAIDLTSAAAGTNYFTFFPNSDFGQLYSDDIGGAITKSATQGESSIETSLYSGVVFGAANVSSLTVAAEDHCLCSDSPFGENRGIILTQKIYSPDVTTTWQKVNVKARNIKTDRDKILLKARTQEDLSFPIFGTDSSENYIATWVDANTFTTAQDLTAVQEAVNNNKFYEIEFIKGAGSGYTAHITSLSYDAGLWTVNIDEDIQNISAGNTAMYVIDNFEKVKTAQGTDSPDEESAKDVIEFVLGGMFNDSKWLQLKFELRGKGVAIEEYEPVLEAHKVTE